MNEYNELNITDRESYPYFIGIENIIQFFRNTTTKNEHALYFVSQRTQLNLKSCKWKMSRENQFLKIIFSVVNKLFHPLYVLL